MPRLPATQYRKSAVKNAGQLNMNKATTAPMWNATMKDDVTQLIFLFRVMFPLGLACRSTRAVQRSRAISRLTTGRESDCNTYVTAVCDVEHRVTVVAETAFSPYSMRGRRLCIYWLLE